MSKGTPVTTIRLSPALLAEIHDAINRTADSYAGMSTVTSWIVKAIRDRLAHQARGRRPGRRRASQVWDPDDLVVPVGWAPPEDWPPI